MCGETWCHITVRRAAGEGTPASWTMRERPSGSGISCLYVNRLRTPRDEIKLAPDRHLGPIPARLIRGAAARQKHSRAGFASAFSVAGGVWAINALPINVTRAKRIMRLFLTKRSWVTKHYTECRPAAASLHRSGQNFSSRRNSGYDNPFREGWT